MKKLLSKIDSLAPTPWIVEGREQSRPLTQISVFILAMVLLLLIVL